MRRVAAVRFAKILASTKRTVAEHLGPEWKGGHVTSGQLIKIMRECYRLGHAAAYNHYVSRPRKKFLHGD